MKGTPGKKSRRRPPKTASSTSANGKTTEETRYLFLGHKVLDEIKILARLASPKKQEREG